MPLNAIAATEALQRLDAFSAIVDARSESEYALDRLPGALNWPSLNDAERASIGTEYKQGSPFAARKRGAVLAARNIATHIERHVWSCRATGRRRLRGAAASAATRSGWCSGRSAFGSSCSRAATRRFAAPSSPRSRRCRPRSPSSPSAARPGRARACCCGAGGARRTGPRSRGAGQPPRLGARLCPASPALAEGLRHLRLGRAAQARSARPVFIESERAKVGDLRVPPALVAACAPPPASGSTCRSMHGSRC